MGTIGEEGFDHMGTVRAHEFISLDGVIEQPSWTAEFGFPDDLGAAVAALTTPATGILLGRRTYEMFETGWSERTVEDDPGAPFFNDTTKYVVSGTLTDPTWRNSTVISYDGVREATRAGDVYVGGSGQLVRSLIADRLLDELHLFVYPIVLGTGDRLFPDGTAAARLTLLASTPLSNGAIHVVYGPA